MNVSFENPPPAGRTETGSAALQLLSNNTLSYRIMISNFASGDAFTAGDLYTGSVEDFGIGRTATLTDEQYLAIKNEAVYVNAHSLNHFGDIIRGQIR